MAGSARSGKKVPGTFLPCYLPEERVTPEATRVWQRAATPDREGPDLTNRHSWCMLRRSVRAGRGRSAVVELAGLAHVQRSRAHQAHVALEGVPQLRQLIEARLAKPWTQARQARGVGRAGTGAERVGTGQPTSRAAAETATSMSRLIARPAGLISLPRPVDRPPSPVRVRRDRSPRKRFRTALAARAPPSRRACTPDGPIQ